MAERGVPWFLKASGAALLALGLVLLSAPAFAKGLVPFQKIDVVECGYTQPDGSIRVVEVRMSGAVFNGQVRDGGSVGFNILLKESVDEIQIREYIDGAYQGIVEKIPDAKKGIRYPCVVYPTGVGRTYELDIVALWKGGGEMCTFNFTTVASDFGIVEISTSGGGETNPPAGIYKYGKGNTITIEAIPYSGYAFSGWEAFRDWGGGIVSKMPFSNPVNLTVDGDYRIRATFFNPSCPPQWTLTVSVNPPDSGFVSLSPPGGTYANGTQVTLTATPASGWRFKSWSGSVDTTSNPVTITMYGNRGAIANFEYLGAPSPPSPTPPSQYTLSVSINPPGSGSVFVSPSGGVYDAGTQVTLVATPDVGWRFVSWSGSVNTTENPVTIAMDGNKSVVANFEYSPPPLPQYTLSVSINPPGSGSVSLSPSGGTYTAGAQVTLTANPASGYRFKSWSGSISATSNPVTVAMDGDKQVTANFEYASAPSCTFYINGREVNPTTSLFLDTSTWRFLLKADRELSGATVTISGAATAAIYLSPEYGIPTQLGGVWSTAKEGRYTVTCTAYYPGGEITVASVEITYGQVTAPPRYTALVLDVVGKGSVSVTEPCGKTEVPEHSIVRVQAFPAPGWRFKAWGGDVAGRGREPYLSFMASGSSMTIVAEFEREVGMEEVAWSFVRSHFPWMLVALGVAMLIGGEFLERRRGW